MADDTIQQVAYQEQISTIQVIFSEFDDSKLGRVALSRVPELIKRLGRSEVVAELTQTRLSNDHANAKSFTFEEVVQCLKVVEQETEGAAEQTEAQPAAESTAGGANETGAENGEEEGETITPLTLMTRLEEYQKQCELMGEYVEAKKAKVKLDQIRLGEEERQQGLVAQAQEHEMTQVELAQKQQFLEFSAAWDRYMAEYESVAYMSLEKLKEQHAKEWAEAQDKIKSHSNVQVKFSRELLEMRRKQQALAKLGLYSEAQEVKNQANNLEKWETAKNSSKTQALRKNVFHYD